MKNCLLLALAVLLSITTNAKKKFEPDFRPGRASKDVACATVDTLYLSRLICRADPEMAGQAELTPENLYRVLEMYQVKFPKIVLAQALLETGNFTSRVCLETNNLFGLRHPSDGSYYTFNTWQESVIAYRDDVQYKYKSGDYYAFLSRIGYAEDRRYVQKVKRVRQTALCFNTL